MAPVKKKNWDGLRAARHKADEEAIKKHLPAFHKYMNSVNLGEGRLQIRNFRRFDILDKEDQTGYRGMFVLGSVRILSNGKLFIEGEISPKPTEGEARDIEKEYLEAKLPAHATALKGHLPKELEGWPEDDLFLFLTPDGKRVQMIQQRVRDPITGIKKGDLPWSMWNDGIWRPMEPDLPDGLPLYGLEQLKDGPGRIFIHEGANVAQRVLKLLKDGDPKIREKREKHPWFRDLKLGAHLAWPGGAPHPSRVDWSPIMRLRNKEVIIVADNDTIGVDAISKISKLISIPCVSIQFTDDFKGGFDLADEWPDIPAWWSKKGRYVGPSMRDLIEPATWATEEIIIPGVERKGAPGYRLKSHFIEEWMSVEEPEAFINVRYQPDVPRNKDRFNRYIRPFSDVDNTARLIEKRSGRKVFSLAYRPFAPGDVEPKRVMMVNGVRTFNTFVPSRIEPAKEGDPKPWLEYMEHLFPNAKDRHEVMRWVATLIAMPERRILYGLLLVSWMHGVGKSTLAEDILLPLLGGWNVAVRESQDVIDSAFNDWLAEKRLVVVHEIFGGKSADAYEKLKSAITQKSVDVNKKFMQPYRVENWAHMFASSNSEEALQFEDNDRRWLMPEVTNKKQSLAFWQKLHHWLKEEDGLSIIAKWANDFVKKKGNAIPEGQEAPSTDTKSRVTDASRSDAQQMAMDLAKAMMEKAAAAKGEGHSILAAGRMRKDIAADLGMSPDDRRMDTLLRLRKVLRKAGLHEHPRRIKAPKENDYVFATFAMTENETWGALLEKASEAKLKV
jgi:hypothetical protein